MFCEYLEWSIEVGLIVNYGEFFGCYGATTEFKVGQEAEVNTFLNLNLIGEYKQYKTNHYFYSLDIKNAMTEFIITMIQNEGKSFHKYISNRFQETDFYSRFYKSWLNPDGVRQTLEHDKGVIFHNKLRKEEDGNIYETRIGRRNRQVTIYVYNPKGKREKLISKPYYGTGDLIDYVNYCDKLIRIGELQKEA